jgi:peptide/nickel transport system permease protein
MQAGSALVLAQRPSSLWRDSIYRLRKNRGAMAGLWCLVALAVVALFAQLISPYDPIEVHLVTALQPPSAAHLFGTDEFGRDILSRIIYGARVAFQIGVLAAVIALGIGVTLGLIAGFYGGRFIDSLIMRCVDVMLGFPYLLLAMIIVAILGPSLTNAMIAVGIVNVPMYARLVRGSVLSIREREYVQACQAVGGTDLRIVLKHILPNVLGPIIIQATLGVGQAIINAAGLSFLGLGAQPPAAEWGAMLASGREYILRAPWVGAFPGMAIFVMVLGFNLMGDGLRDALDPKLK